jgi:hypothetical protein
VDSSGRADGRRPLRAQIKTSATVAPVRTTMPAPIMVRKTCCILHNEHTPSEFLAGLAVQDEPAPIFSAVSIVHRYRLVQSWPPLENSRTLLPSRSRRTRRPSYLD